MVFAAGSIHGVFSSEEVPIQLDQHDYQKESVASAIRLWADGILASLSLKKRSDEVRPRDEPDKPTQLLDHLHGGFALNIEQSKSTYLSKTPIQFQLKRFLTKLAVNPALQTEAMAAFDAFVEKTTNDVRALHSVSVLQLLIC